MFTDLLSLIFNKNLSKRKIEFTFIVHPRGTSDIFRRYKFLKILPKKIINGILMVFWPTYGGYIKVQEGDKTRWGGIIICPLTGKQMLKHKRLSAYKSYLAAKLSKIYGAKVVGLGALTSVVTDGGKYVSDRLPNLHLTSGNSLTTATTTNDILDIIKDKNITGPISIIGATGSIGKGIAKILDQECSNDLILIGKNPERTLGLINDLHRKDNILCTTDIKENNRAEVVIVTTSADGAVLDYELLKNAKVIYDITQPKNTPEHIVNDGKILYIDGGLIQLPESVKLGMDVGLPKGLAFSCLSETILIAISGNHHLKSQKDLKVENIKELSKLAKENNFNSYLIQNGNK